MNGHDALAEHLNHVATYNRSANAILLATLEARRGEPPRALAAFRHVLETETVWLSRLTGSDRATALFPRLGTAEAELATCRTWLEEASAGLAAYVQGIPAETLTGDFTYFNMKGEPRTNRLDRVLQHTFLHSAQYRGEALGLLAAAGPVPDVDYIFFASGEARFGKTPAS